MEFTFEQYKMILTGFIENGYNVKSVKEYLLNPGIKSVALRHDVDRFPGQSLRMAEIEASSGIKSTYYFRTKPSVFKEEIIKSIVQMEHEIGYHYDDLAAARGNYEQAVCLFEKNLEKLRKYYPVETICMHGSPVSLWNNRNLWKKYDYKNYGIKADLYLDIDYNSVFYLTDNGFGWNRFNKSVRDKVETEYDIVIKDTSALLEKIKENKLAPHVLFNSHPDTYFDPGIKWILNYLFIKSKNPIKWLIVKTGLLK